MVEQKEVQQYQQEVSSSCGLNDNYLKAKNNLFYLRFPLPGPHISEYTSPCKKIEQAVKGKCLLYCQKSNFIDKKRRISTLSRCLFPTT